MVETTKPTCLREGCDERPHTKDGYCSAWCRNMANPVPEYVPKPEEYRFCGGVVTCANHRVCNRKIDCNAKSVYCAVCGGPK